MAYGVRCLRMCVCVCMNVLGGVFLSLRQQQDFSLFSSIFKRLAVNDMSAHIIARDTHEHFRWEWNGIGLAMEF